VKGFDKAAMEAVLKHALRMNMLEFPKANIRARDLTAIEKQYGCVNIIGR
jgi:hypothetical protein